jgi:nucleotide-binding universal stress UspA family protein
MRVLVAVDSSLESNSALRYTCHLLEGSNAWVETLYVKPHEADLAPEYFAYPFVERAEVAEWIDEEAEQVEEQVLASFDLCAEGKVACWRRVASGDPAEEILKATERRRYDMIVLGSQGKSALKGFLLGAVHANILHHARQPILIVRSFRPINRVLIAYRGSQCDQGALSFVASLLARRQPEMTVLHVQETARGETESFAETCVLQGWQTLKKSGYSPVTKTARGDFVDEILKEVATERYDLIVLGAYGHKRPKYLRIISDEALNLVRLTSRPVLVYRDFVEVS